MNMFGATINPGCLKIISEDMTKLAGVEGFEPSYADSESAVLPLDDSPAPDKL